MVIICGLCKDYRGLRWDYFGASAIPSPMVENKLHNDMEAGVLSGLMLADEGV